MNAKKFGVGASLACALICAFGSSRQVRAQSSKTMYPKMAPVEQYLMDRDAEIVLARSAAPEAISRDATVLVLGRRGYETAVQGKNGFVCAVERAWMGPFDSPEFWNPKNRAAVCYNPPAARSILPTVEKRTALALAGLSTAQILNELTAEYARKGPPALEPGAMSFMMSKDAYLTDDDGHNLAHLMFYTPLMDGVNWGADLPKSPVLLLQKGPPEPFNIFLVPVGKWSDGTPAPLPR